MRDTTLILLFKDQQKSEILLGYKKIGFGRGRFTGFGGKVEPGETLQQAAIREFVEETGIFINPQNLSYVALLSFVFPWKPSWNQNVHVFTAKSHEKHPFESQEMIPEWFAIHELPYQQMWDDARYWLPRIIAGETFKAKFTFQPDNSTVVNAVFYPLTE